jgi:hypothetical protein
MRTRSISFAVAVLAGGLFSSGTLAVDGTTTGEAPMRVGPGEGFAEIGSVDAGSVLKIHSCHDGQAWCLVRVSGRSGWVPGELVRAGGFSRAKSYFDSAAKVALQYDVNDRELFDDTLLGPRGVPIRRPFRRFRGDRAFDPRGFPVHSFNRFHRSRMSDKQLPRFFRSTIHTPGFRLEKQGFPEIIDGDSADPAEGHRPPRHHRRKRWSGRHHHRR